MAVGFKTINNVTYYFYSGSGAMATGWVENTDKGTKYYFDPTTGAMYTGTQTIDGVTYVFSDTGVCRVRSRMTLHQMEIQEAKRSRTIWQEH